MKIGAVLCLVVGLQFAIQLALAQSPLFAYQSPHSLSTGTGESKRGGINFCDLNGDGVLDMIYTSEDGSGGSSRASVKFFIASSIGNYVERTSEWNQWEGNTVETIHAESIVCGDFNKDGKTDIAVNDPTEIIILENQYPADPPLVKFYALSKNSSPLASEQDSTLNSHMLSWMDLNLDGRLDIVFDNGDRGHQYIKFKSDGKFDEAKCVDVTNAGLSCTNIGSGYIGGFGATGDQSMYNQLIELEIVVMNVLC
jgi:hypothetical protein